MHKKRRGFLVILVEKMLESGEFFFLLVLQIVDGYFSVFEAARTKKFASSKKTRRLRRTPSSHLRLIFGSIF